MYSFNEEISSFNEELEKFEFDESITPEEKLALLNIQKELGNAALKQNV